MLQFISLLAGIGIFYIFIRDSREYEPFSPPEYNTIITFEPEYYSDIKWYESFRNFSRWESCDTYSFRGHLEIEEVPVFIETFEKELDITTDNYQIFYYENNGSRSSYVIIFKDMERPKIEGIPHLEILGDWVENGELGYRLATSIPEEKIRELLESNLELNDKDFSIFNTASFAWTRFI